MRILKSSNAKRLGSARFPAEWEKHEATWLVWPRNSNTWPGNLLKEVEGIYLQMLRALLPNEIVHLLVPDARVSRKIQNRLETLKVSTHSLRFHLVPTQDVWIRDFGPIFVKRKQSVEFTKWIFNAWGGKYRDLAKDHGAVDRIAALAKHNRVDIPMVLEGGSIEVNGRGTLISTEQCLLNPNRNPKLDRLAIEGRLKKYLGVQNMIWLKAGIEGDDTDGHVDDITRFVGVRTILTAMESDSSDKNYAILKENRRILSAARDQDHRKLTLLDLPMPGVVRDQKSGRRLPASYANYYVANGVVLLPVYSHAHDRAAVRILKKAFPTRKIIPIECTALVHGLGSIHCVTQQQPA